ncbi:MAG TPA: 3-oxoadipate enol-lactonase [Acidobacteriaceae bacterium]|nr:3-oxoadipate enol-lactonase [Acidobacteriaceae bacterium]
MPSIEVSGARLFYTLSGKADAPVLMMSNSLGTTLEMWQPQLAAMEGRFHLLRYDMRGHGKSDVTEAACSIATLGQDVLSLLDELQIEKVHFCGLSIGGVIGQWLGANAPQRLKSLVLCNTAATIGTLDSWNERIAAVEQGGVASIADAAIQRWFTPAFRLASPGAVAPLQAMLLATNPRGYVLLCAALRDMDQRKLVERIHLPTFIIAGDHDPATTLEDAKFLQGRIPGAKLVSLPVAHISNVEAADQFNAAVIEFLQGIDNRA